MRLLTQVYHSNICFRSLKENVFLCESCQRMNKWSMASNFIASILCEIRVIWNVLLWTHCAQWHSIDFNAHLTRIGQFDWPRNARDQNVLRSLTTNFSVIYWANNIGYFLVRCVLKMDQNLYATKILALE